MFAANDSLAFRAIGVLRSMGHTIPDDVGVVGFDDIPLAREMVPPLTTVHIPLTDIGRIAGSRLRQLIESGGPSDSESDVVPAQAHPARHRLEPRGAHPPTVRCPPPTRKEKHPHGARKPRERARTCEPSAGLGRAVLAFHRAQGETFDQVSLDDHAQTYQWQNDQHAGRRDAAPFDRPVGDERREIDR